MQDPFQVDHDPLDLSEELLAWVKPELAPGEQILWASYSGTKPTASIAILVKQGIFTFVSLGIGVLFFFLIEGPFHFRFSTYEAWFTLLGLIGICGGCLTLLFTICTLINLIGGEETIGPAIYALTEKRAMIWRSLRSSEAVEVSIFYRGSIKTLHRLEYRDGSGSLTFNQSSKDNPSSPSIGFEVIANVRRVEELVRHFLFLPDTSDEDNIL